MVAAAPASRVTFASAALKCSHTRMTAKASSTAYRTPTVANLNPATSLLMLSVSRRTNRRMIVGPAIASRVGRPTTTMPDSHSGAVLRNSGLLHAVRDYVGLGPATARPIANPVTPNIRPRPMTYHSESASADG